MTLRSHRHRHRHGAAIRKSAFTKMDADASEMKLLFQNTFFPTSEAETENKHELTENSTQYRTACNSASNVVSVLTDKLVASSVQSECCYLRPNAAPSALASETSELHMSKLIEIMDSTSETTEQIVEEELAYIFKQTFDSVEEMQLDSSSGEYFRKTISSDCFYAENKPSIVSSAELSTEQTHTPIRLSQAALSSIPLDEYSVLDKIDVSGTINVSCERLPQKPPIANKMLSAMRNRNNWDTKIYIGNDKFHCHLCALQMYASYFHRFDAVNTGSIRLPTKWVTPEAFRVIYDWMLEEKTVTLAPMSNRSIFELYSAAHFLGISELIESMCVTFDTIKNEDEIFSLLPEVFQLGLPSFEQLFLSRICSFYLTLVASQEFVEMKAQNVVQLLASQNIGVNSEIEVFYSAVRWLHHEWPERRAYIPDLMKCVRFGLMPPTFLRFLQTPQKTRVLHAISKCEFVKEAINKAFVYTSTALFHKDPHEELKFQLPDFELPEMRKWIYDEKCPHHHNLACSRRQFFSYAQFLQYLETQHHNEVYYWKALKYLDAGVQCCPR
ncbi:hypothetical protein KR222_005616 [Zaprionus bogoriensis]|nr:hypothetical protein KR222_005616 [Zaprionus bogoriensis]